MLVISHNMKYRLLLAMTVSIALVGCDGNPKYTVDCPLPPVCTNDVQDRATTTSAFEAVAMCARTQGHLPTAEYWLGISPNGVDNIKALEWFQDLTLVGVYDGGRLLIWSDGVAPEPTGVRCFCD